MSDILTTPRLKNRSARVKHAMHQILALSITYSTDHEAFSEKPEDSYVAEIQARNVALEEENYKLRQLMSKATSGEGAKEGKRRESIADEEDEL